MPRRPPSLLLFFFNDTATTEIYTLSLHDALPILDFRAGQIEHIGDQHDGLVADETEMLVEFMQDGKKRDRKSTRLNSSHQIISYAVFCLKKKNDKNHPNQARHTPTAITYRFTYVH